MQPIVRYLVEAYQKLSPLGDSLSVGCPRESGFSHSPFSEVPCGYL